MSIDTQDMTAFELLMDDAVACTTFSVTGETCKSEAEWIYSPRCCGHQYLLCDSHRIKLHEHCARLEGLNRYCQMCRFVFTYESIDKRFVMVKL